MRLRTPLTTRAAGSDVKAVAWGGAVNFAGGVGGAVATFLLLVVLARGSGVTETGLFFQAVAVVSTAAVVGNMGASITLMQRVARRLAHGEHDLHDLVSAAVLPVTAATVGGALLLGVLHDPVASLLTSPPHRHDLGLLLVATAPALPLVALTRLVVTLARGTGDMVPAALYDSGGQPVLRLLLCGLVALGHGPLWAVGAAFTGAAALSFLGSLPHTGRALRRAHARVGRPFGWVPETAGPFWRFSAPRGLEEIFAATNVWLLVVLVGAMVSASEAATYAAVSRFTLAATLMMQAITTGMAPRFSAAFARGEHARAQGLFRVTTQWMVGLSVPVCVTLFLYPHALLHLVSPDLPGGALGLRLTAVASLFTVVTGPAGGAILFAGRSSWNLGIALAAFAAMLAVAVAAIPGGGANGASLAWAVAMTVQSACAYVVAKQAFGLDPFSPSASRLGAWSAILSVGAELVPLLLWGDRVSAMLIGVIVTGVALMVLHTATSWSWWRPSAADAPSLEAP